MQTDLVDVILRWRLYPFVFCADIEKMYRQILVDLADRDYQRILWSTDPQKPPIAYRLGTVTYGLACAPFLAIRVLHQLTVDEGPRFPLTAGVIQENFYVDDCLSGADSVQEAQEKANQIDQVLSASGFHLQKWASNFEDVLADVDKSRCQNISKTFEGDPMLRALGISWCPVNDSFVLTVEQETMTSAVELTKRTILSSVAKLFDPIGWITPVIVVAKIFRKSLWKIPLNWDDKLPDSLVAEWKTFEQNLRSSTSFSIPRWINTNSSSEVEFHGLSDASGDALAAVVYLRVYKENLDATTSLLTAKTKVAPLRAVTIARLELSAAVLLARLVQRCQTALHLENAPSVDGFIRGIDLDQRPTFKMEGFC